MRRQDDIIQACKIYAEAILESIEDYKNPESMKNGQTTMHDIRDYSNWMLETIKPVLNNDGKLNEYKGLVAARRCASCGARLIAGCKCPGHPTAPVTISKEA